MLRNEWFSVLIKTAEQSSLQVRVPKRVVKKANRRNMVKRLVRDCFLHADKSKNFEVTVSCKAEFLKQDRVNVRIELTKIFEKGLT